MDALCPLALARVLRENSRMHRLSIVLVLAAACGGSSKTTTTETTPTGPAEGSGSAETAPVVGPPQVAWKDMTKEQRGKFMAKVVMPKFKPMFQEFDPKGFAKFECETCHGEAAKNHTFKMPNPDIFVLPEAPADFQKLAQEKPDWMKFMPKVEEEMAKTLGLPAYDPKAPSPDQFGCYGCHTHKPGGGDAKP